MTHLAAWGRIVIFLSILALPVPFAMFFGVPFSEILAFIERIWHQPIMQVGSVDLTVDLLAEGILYLILLWFGAKYVSGSLRTHVLDSSSLDTGHKYVIQRGVKYFVLALGVLVGLQISGLDVSSITVFGGALGIGLGLGFQTIVKNFASGLMLLVEQPIRVGDRVEVDGLRGEIVSILSRSTWVKTNDNVVMIVPNSEFIEGRVTNWTANDRSVRIALPFGVSYDCDPEEVRAVGRRVAAENQDVLDEPTPDVAFRGYGDSSLDFELRVWTSSRVATPVGFRSDLYYQLFAALKEANMEIPFPQRDLHVRSLPESAAKDLGRDGPQT